MKLGIAYIAFDGIELLESNIKQIRDHSDYVSVIFQKKSWFGFDMILEDMSELNRLVERKLIDELIEFTDFTPLKNYSDKSITDAKWYEKQKRKLALAKCLQNNCTHFLCMDVDEFYKSDEFELAKNIIQDQSYDCTATNYINYIHTPILQRGEIVQNHFVPFISKITNNSNIGTRFFVNCDPTRRIQDNFRSTHLFSHDTILMHHMETVRKDLYRKLESTSRSNKGLHRGYIKDMVTTIKSIDLDSQYIYFKNYFNGFSTQYDPKKYKQNIRICDNIFNIPYNKW